ncbi:hypothetical protein VUR80DRAFT_7814 [Thermomyces stellatus]
MPPPDLSSYVLSDTLSRQLFETTILPAEFPPTIQPSACPLAVLLLGQTGAGKTRTAPTLHTYLSAGRSPPIHLIADTYKAFHPSYPSLSSSNPALASAAAGPDARRWLAMAVDEAVSRRVDVLLESACRHPNDFISLAEKFKEGGYRVEVVVLAVPEGLSRLGILTRYYQKLPEAGSRGLPIRLTPRKVHDDSYAGLLASAEWLDLGKVDQVLVVRRGNLVAFGSETVDGRLKGSVAEVVQGERRRPLSDDEARTAREDIARLVGIEAAAADVEEVKTLLEPLLQDGGRPEAFPPLQPLLFPEPANPARRADNMLRLGG